MRKISNGLAVILMAVSPVAFADIDDAKVEYDLFINANVGVKSSDVGMVGVTWLALAEDYEDRPIGFYAAYSWGQLNPWQGRSLDIWQLGFTYRFDENISTYIGTGRSKKTHLPSEDVQTLGLVYTTANFAFQLGWQTEVETPVIGFGYRY